MKLQELPVGKKRLKSTIQFESSVSAGLLKDYLTADRFYSHTYPLAGITEKMVSLSAHRQALRIGLLKPGKTLIRASWMTGLQHGFFVMSSLRLLFSKLL